MEQPIRLSHSTMELFNSCERLFQLEKLLVTDSVREESHHLSFGTAFGAGVADYFVHQDINKALYTGWLEYWPEIEAKNKTIPHYVSAMLKAKAVMDTLLQDYEVVYFQDKPAVELSFRVNITPQYYYVGYMDIVLRNKWDGTCVVVDAKSTGLQLLDLSPLYQNSGQALAYSIVLDAVTGEAQANYSVMYFVAQMTKTHEVNIHPLVYRKTLLDRLNWFLALGSDVKRLELAEEIGFYPRRGGSCLKYNKPCKHFGTCTLSSFDKPKEIEPDEVEYQFVFELEDLIDNHIERINS